MIALLAGGGRYGSFVSVLLAVVDHHAESPEWERARLWLREGWAPPELPPGSNEPER